MTRTKAKKGSRYTPRIYTLGSSVPTSYMSPLGLKAAGTNITVQVHRQCRGQGTQTFLISWVIFNTSTWGRSRVLVSALQLYPTFCWCCFTWGHPGASETVLISLGVLVRVVLGWWQGDSPTGSSWDHSHPPLGQPPACVARPMGTLGQWPAPQNQRIILVEKTVKIRSNC